MWLWDDHKVQRHGPRYWSMDEGTCSFLPNYTIRSNPWTPLNLVPCRETGSKTRKVNWSKCEGTSLLGTEHTGCPSLIILSLVTLIHQHKHMGGTRQDSAPTAPLWGLWWCQPSQVWRVICQKLRHISLEGHWSSGRILVHLSDDLAKILASWWNTAGRALLWLVFFNQNNLLGLVLFFNSYIDI